MLGKIRITQKILTSPNKINCWRNPKFARENTKDKKQKNGIIITNHDNNNIT
jgi:hypothetical protein